MRKEDWLLIAPIMLLSANLLYRIIDFAEIMWRFPLDYVNDLSSYVAMLHFLNVYGYHSIVPNWYQGFVLFQVYPPGWFFFTYPLVQIFNDVMIATFVSVTLLYGIGFGGIWLIGKTLKISVTKTIALYLFVFANPMILGAVLKQGRIPAFMALVIVVYIMWILLYFKDNKVDSKIGLLAGLFGLLLITHSPEVLLLPFAVLGLLLVKNNKERILIVWSLTLGVLLASFWLVGFIEGTIELGILENAFSKWLLDFSGGFLVGNIVLIALPIILIALWWIKYKQTDSKRELLFWLPIIVLAVLVLCRLVVFIPLIKQVYNDTYQDWFILTCSILLLSIDWKKFGKRILSLFYFAILIVTIAGVLYNVLHTPYMEEYSERNYEMLAMLEQVEDVYLILGLPEGYADSYEKAYYSYAAMFLDKRTASGWGPWFKEAEYIEEIEALHESRIIEQGCEETVDHLHSIGVIELISYDRGCQYFTEVCNFEEKSSEGFACLLTVPVT